jgi:hypothetical protein
MRYADEHTQRQFEALQRKGGRPANSPGWSMLVACKTGAFVSERNPTERADITAGTTYEGRRLAGTPLAPASKDTRAAYLPAPAATRVEEASPSPTPNRGVWRDVLPPFVVSAVVGRID